MQPLHYCLRDPAAKDNSITHAAAAPSNLGAAIKLQCILQHHVANRQHRMTTIMQPFQCDLQPQSQETHRTTHTGTTTRCRTQRRNQNDPSRNRRTHEVPFIAGCSHFTRKNTRLYCYVMSSLTPPLS